jgi:predicted phosphoribosyltransferase
LAEQPPARAVVLGLPRGGVPVAAEVAAALAAPLDVLVVRKLGLPWHPELAMGAVGEDDALIVNEDVTQAAGVSESEVQLAIDREREEVAQRAARFREGRPGVDLTGRTAVIVDDGIATGATARAACAVARARGAARVVLAVPVAPAGLSASFLEADEVVCLHEPPEFVAVGMHYADFAQVQDAEVIATLRAARR